METRYTDHYTVKLSADSDSYVTNPFDNITATIHVQSDVEKKDYLQHKQTVKKTRIQVEKIVGGQVDWVFVASGLRPKLDKLFRELHKELFRKVTLTISPATIAEIKTHKYSPGGNTPSRVFVHPLTVYEYK